VFGDRGLLPLQRPITTVVGAPIAVTRVDAATAGQAAFDAAVDELHETYCAALQQLFDEWKDQLAPHRKGDLEVVG
jgi:hypothetical protein